MVPNPWPRTWGIRDKYQNIHPATRACNNPSCVSKVWCAFFSVDRNMRSSGRLRAQLGIRRHLRDASPTLPQVLHTLRESIDTGQGTSVGLRGPLSQTGECPLLTPVTPSLILRRHVTILRGVVPIDMDPQERRARKRNSNICPPDWPRQRRRTSSNG